MADVQLSHSLETIQQVMSDLAEVDRRPNKAVWGVRPKGFSSTFDLTIDLVSSAPLEGDEVDLVDNEENPNFPDSFVSASRVLVVQVKVQTREETDSTGAFSRAEMVRTKLNAESVREKFRKNGLIYVESDTIRQVSGRPESGRMYSAAVFFATFTSRSLEQLTDERAAYIGQASFEPELRGEDNELIPLDPITVSGET